MAEARRIRIDLSAPILTETIRVLREKFVWDGYRLHAARQMLLSLSNQVTPTQTLNVIAEDEADDRILECAVEAGSEYIVTWDKDLLRLRTYEGIKIVTAPEFMKLIEPGRMR